MPGTFSESRIVKIWRDSLPGRTDLLTEEGDPVRIVYPGRLNGDRGADYRDAVIETGRGLLRGDVEVHVKSSGWREHRHHQDPVYNRVVLHVVFWHDAVEDATLQNGKKIPTLALHRYIDDNDRGLTGPVVSRLNYRLPCHDTVRRRDAVVRITQRLNADIVIAPRLPVHDFFDTYRDILFSWCHVQVYAN